MANSIAQSLADDILNWVKGTTFPAAPATLYIALLTAVPTTNAGTGLTEVSGSSYARIAVTSSSGWSAISQAADQLHDQISNAAAVTFATVTTTGYTVAGVAVYSAATAGTLYAYGAVTSQAVSVGNAYSLAAGALVLEF